MEQDSDLYNKTKSVPKHNKFAKSIFAYMDCLMKARQNVSERNQEDLRCLEILRKQQ